MLFVDMAPRAAGSYQPLIGYTVLELAGALVDMVDHRLQRRPFYSLKRGAAGAAHVSAC